MLALSTRYYGTRELLPQPVDLRAGPLSLVYDGGDLRYIKLGEIEIVRRIYVAVRDHNWDTIMPMLHEVEMDIGERTFSISYLAVHVAREIDFRWRGSITGDEQGRIVFRMDGQAHSDFQRNRIGFCVLHPMACAGTMCRIEHVDNTQETAAFPVFIAPQLHIDGVIQPVHPFSDMRSMTHEITQDLWAKVSFSGEVFEMEDQRNWTDASYKTYGTPLSLPFPVPITKGTEVVQSVTLTLEGEIPAQNREAAADTKVEPVRLVVDRAQTRAMPVIGLGMASHGRPLSQHALDSLRALNLGHLRVDLDLADADVGASLQTATDAAHALGAKLEIALFTGDDAERQLQALLVELKRVQPPVARWLLFHAARQTTPAGLVDLARGYLEPYEPAAWFGAGSNAYFTDVNRDRPDMQNADLLTYSINPQVHAFDNASLVETLAAQAVTVESAREFAQGCAIVVSSVTLLPRFNPNATGPQVPPAPGELPPQVDVRQMSLFGAAWTVGSLKYLCNSGIHAVTYYETTGWRGVMEREDGSPLPEQFPSKPGAVFPLYHVLADAGEYAGGEILPVQTSHPLLVDALALRRDDRLTVLVANYGPHAQTVSVSGLGAQARLRALDEDTFALASEDPSAFREAQSMPLETVDGTLHADVLPYGVLRVDSNTEA